MFDGRSDLDTSRQEAEEDHPEVQEFPWPIETIKAREDGVG